MKDIKDGSNGEPFTEAQFVAWCDWFISKHPQHAIVLRAVSNWRGDDLWRWSKRVELIKHLTAELNFH